MLFVSSLSLFLPCLLLNLASIQLLLSSGLSSLKSLGFNKLCVSDFFVLFLLLLHNSELFLFKGHHPSLLKGLGDQNVKHRFDFSVEVKQIRVLIVNLGCLAVFLRRHLRLEERNGWSVKVELSSNSFLTLRWLISQHFDVLLCLELSVLASRHRLRCRNVSVRVNLPRSLRSLSHLIVE